MDERSLRLGLRTLFIALVAGNVITALLAARAYQREDAEYEARLVAQHDSTRLTLHVAELEATVDSLEAQLADQRDLVGRVQASWERCEERALQ
jgi:hypothetical protein